MSINVSFRPENGSIWKGSAIKIADISMTINYPQEMIIKPNIFNSIDGSWDRSANGTVAKRLLRLRFGCLCGFLGYLDVICGAWLTGDVTGSLTIGVIGGFASDYRVKCRWIIIINETLFKTIQ